MKYRLHVFNDAGSKKVAIISFDSGDLSATYFEDAARREIEPLLTEPIEHETGEAIYKGGVMITGTATAQARPGTEDHFFALNDELFHLGYWPDLEEGIKEQAATA